METESKVADFVAVINDLRDFVYGQPPSLTLTVLLDQLKVCNVCKVWCGVVCACTGVVRRRCWLPSKIFLLYIMYGTAVLL